MKSDSRAVKNLLYEQVARMGKAVSSPKRLELIEILVQGEKPVEQLAHDADISVKLASAHLKQLKASQLVESRRAGQQIFYRLADDRVAILWVVLREAAEHHLFELQEALRELVTQPAELASMKGEELVARAHRGEVTVLDVRPAEEFRHAHLPYARSIPLTELRHRVNEIPSDRPVVAYCRGPFCLWATEAVHFLSERGLKATRIEEGVAEWKAAGLPLANL